MYIRGELLNYKIHKMELGIAIQKPCRDIILENAHNVLRGEKNNIKLHRQYGPNFTKKEKHM